MNTNTSKMQPNSKSPSLDIQNLKTRRGESLVLDDLCLKVGENEIVGLVGASGIGKTTLLYAIAGLLPLQSGKILWNGKDLVEVPVHKRGFGLVFQDHLLFPHKNVFENIAFGLRFAGWARKDVQNRVGELLELLGLEGFEKRNIRSLSGGQAQRVSLGRALAPKPVLLLMDEPLAALDQTLRDSLAAEIHGIIKSQGIPAIYVTHDLREVFSTVDTLALLKDGKIHRHGSPVDLRNDPGDEYTASFFGLTNVLEAEVAHSADRSNIPALMFPWGKIAVHSLGQNLTNLPIGPDKCKILILPEAIKLVDRDAQGTSIRSSLAQEGVPVISEPIPAKILTSCFTEFGYQLQLELDLKSAPSTQPLTLQAFISISDIPTLPTPNSTCYISITSTYLRIL